MAAPLPNVPPHSMFLISRGRTHSNYHKMDGCKSYFLWIAKIAELVSLNLNSVTQTASLMVHQDQAHLKPRSKLNSAPMTPSTHGALTAREPSTKPVHNPRKTSAPKAKNYTKNSPPRPPRTRLTSGSTLVSPDFKPDWFWEREKGWNFTEFSTKRGKKS